jgi:hypothetical protein
LAVLIAGGHVGEGPFGQLDARIPFGKNRITADAGGEICNLLSRMLSRNHFWCLSEDQ